MIWIFILNHLYLGDLILILKSTYDDFAHLCPAGTNCKVQSIPNLSGRHAKILNRWSILDAIICYLICIEFSHKQVILLSHCVSMGVNVDVVKFSNEAIFQARRI